MPLTVNAPQPVTRPFTGQGHHRDEDGSDEDGSDEDGPYCPSMAHDWDGDVCKTCGTTRERWDSAPPGREFGNRTERAPLTR